MIRLLIATESIEENTRIQRLLRHGGLESDAVTSTDAVRARLTRDDFDILLVEAALLTEHPERFVAELQAVPEHPGIIVLTREDVPRQRATLLASGCDAILWLGLDDETLGEALVSLARRGGDLVLERLGAGRSQRRSTTLSDFTSSSPSMQRFVQMARQVVKGDSALLILGETGVGKERLARSIHDESPRSRGPFITVNCAALPEALLESELFGHEEGAFTGAVRARRGYFELADRGTLFLDEIGELPLHLQVKLLRVLEDKTIQRVGSEKPIAIDVRIVAATNREPKREMEEGRFRPDLYYRLAVVTLTVPPLRERREDIPELARAFLVRSSRQLRKRVTDFEPKAVDALIRHDWPGNVRELINVVERGVLLTRGEVVRLEDLRADPGAEATRSAPSPDEGRVPLEQARRQVIEGFERDYLASCLTETHGRIAETAELAGISERTLYSMMKRYGLKKEDFRAARQKRYNPVHST